MAQPSAEFTAIYRAHARDVLRFALYLCGDRAEAEDIVSDTFVAAWTTPTAIVADTVKAYLFTIARNLYVKRRKQQGRYVELSDDHADASPGPAASAEQRHRLDQVSAEIARLPDIERTALLMRADGIAYADIAAALGLTTGAARVRVHRARTALMSFK